MTQIGVLEGEVLAFLDEHGSTSMRRLTRELDGPSPLIMMAIGALVRQGLIRVVQHDLEVIFEPIETMSQATEPIPEVWGG
ncbi:MAG: winged helix-turn-helix domain-containing protein [Candidatus Omnitrophica bacterium]|nr:winged helix-turn-helix domain-containing protein [Candidatus Omnitrophota bacterium]